MFEIVLRDSTQHGMFETTDYQVRGRRSELRGLDDFENAGVRCRLVPRGSTPAGETTSSRTHRLCQWPVASKQRRLQHLKADPTRASLPGTARGKGVCPPKHVCRLRRPMNGTRPASKAFGDLVRQSVCEYGLD